MTLAFNVRNAGPLSQVGFDLPSFGTAVYLATHVYGWYQSHNRALTLEQTLSSAGVSLASVSTFDRTRYSNIRHEHGGVWGAVKEKSGLLTRLQLPKASTALEGDPGFVCLRALVVGLLCFVQEAQICSILKVLLPRRLLNYNQEGEDAIIEDACLASISHYVQAVSKEEAVEDLCNRLRELTDSQILRVSNGTSDQILTSQQTEMGHVVGFLDWLLTPHAARKSSSDSMNPSRYATRSLKVWCLALVLSELGFEAEAARQAVGEPSAQQSKDGHSYFNHYHDVPEVVLVLIPGVLTDQGIKVVPSDRLDFSTEIQAPPRIIPVRAFPAIAYAEYVSAKIPNCGMQDAHDLEEAFLGNFVSVRDRLSREPYLRRAAGFDMPLPNKDFPKPTSWIPGDLIRLFDSYLGGEENSSWIADRGDIIKEYSWIILEGSISQYLKPYFDDRKFKEGHTNIKSKLIMDHIIFSTVLAVISLFVHPKGDLTQSGLDMDFVYTGVFKVVNGEPKLHAWYGTLMRTLLMMQALYEEKPWLVLPEFKVRQAIREKWAVLIAEVLTGTTLDSTQVIHGAQNHGLAVVSRFLLQPTPDTRSTFHYDCVRGQLLDIPTKEGLILEGHTEVQRVRGITLQSIQGRDSIEALQRDPPSDALDQLRMDAEPCWDHDTQKLCINVRLGGRPVIQLNPTKLIGTCQDSRLKYNNCECVSSQPCLGPKTIEYLLTGDSQDCKWHSLPLLQMVQRGQLALTDLGELKGSQNNWLVQTQDNPTMLMLALATSFSSGNAPTVILVTNCLGSALVSYVTNHKQQKGPTMIILNKAKSSLDSFSKPPQDQPQQIIDLLRGAAYFIEEACCQHTLSSDSQMHSLRKQAEKLIGFAATHGHRATDAPTAVNSLIDARSNGSIDQNGVFTILHALLTKGAFDPDGTTGITACVLDRNIQEWKQANPNHVLKPPQVREQHTPVPDWPFRAMWPVVGWYPCFKDIALK